MQSSVESKHTSLCSLSCVIPQNEFGTPVLIKAHSSFN